jgi:hypothetical protein
MRSSSLMFKSLSCHSMSRQIREIFFPRPNHAFQPKCVRSWELFCGPLFVLGMCPEPFPRVGIIRAHLELIQDKIVVVDEIGI